MENLLSLLQQSGNLKLEVSSTDLVAFSDQLISRARAELTPPPTTSPQAEEYVSRKTAMELLDVCPATLWAWSKRNYLVPIRVGQRLRYRKSDIDRILEGQYEK